MKKMMIFMVVLKFVFSAALAQAKLSDHQSMKCIDSDRPSKSVFQDLQAAYEMRLVSAKDFFNVMDKPANCPQLRKDLKKLHASALGSFPRAKSAARMDSGLDAGSNYAASDSEDFSASPPPPVPLPESDFGDDFGDFR